MPDLEFASPNSRELQDKLRGNLARIFEFSPEDLAQNQAGKFGPGQLRRVRTKIAAPLYAGVVAAVGWLTFVWMLNNSTWFASLFESMYYMRNGLYREFTDASPLSILIGLLFAIAPWFFRSSPATAFFLLIDFLFGEVAKIEGKVWLSQTTASNIGARADDPNASETDYQYAIGDLKFDVPYGATAALDENAPYRVYYTPRSNVLLSIEPI